jgi:hypothetical protein
MLLDHKSHHKITFKEKLLEINPRMEFQFKKMLMGELLSLISLVNILVIFKLLMVGLWSPIFLKDEVVWVVSL